MYKGREGGWMPPLHKVCLSFFLEDKTSAPVVFSSCSFIPRAHFETRLVMFSCYGYEIWVISSRWSRQFWVEIHAFSTSFDSESKYYVIFQVKDKKCHFSRNSSNSINQSINQSLISIRYVKELKNSFKIRTCINKIYNNYSYIILFNFKNNSINIYI